jgi:hypothetical protein
MLARCNTLTRIVHTGANVHKSHFCSTGQFSVVVGRGRSGATTITPGIHPTNTTAVASRRKSSRLLLGPAHTRTSTHSRIVSVQERAAHGYTTTVGLQQALLRSNTTTTTTTLYPRRSNDWGSS